MISNFDHTCRTEIIRFMFSIRYCDSKCFLIAVLLFSWVLISIIWSPNWEQLLRYKKYARGILFYFIFRFIFGSWDWINYDKHLSIIIIKVLVYIIKCFFYIAIVQHYLIFTHFILQLQTTEQLFLIHYLKTINTIPGAI